MHVHSFLNQRLCPEDKVEIECMQQDVSHDANYKRLRELVHSSNPPCIPYLGKSVSGRVDDHWERHLSHRLDLHWRRKSFFLEGISELQKVPSYFWTNRRGDPFQGSLLWLEASPTNHKNHWLPPRHDQRRVVWPLLATRTQKSAQEGLGVAACCVHNL